MSASLDEIVDTTSNSPPGASAGVHPARESDGSAYDGVQVAPARAPGSTASPGVPADVPPLPVAPASLPAPSSVYPSMPPSATYLPTLLDGLRLRVRVGQGSGPLWGFAVLGVAAALAVVALTSAVLSAIVARTTAPSAATSSVPSARPAVSLAPPPDSATAVPEPPTPLELAARGEASAMKQIAERPVADRNVDEIVALASGRGVDKQRGVVALRRRAETDADFASSAELADRLRSAVDDPDTTRAALEVMAKLPSPLGPDLLYSIASSRRRPEPVTELATELLATKTVRGHASKALVVLLDLKGAESCEQAKDALERAAEHADQRALSVIARFGNKRGCGAGKLEDCWPCLREGDVFKSAARSSAKRPPPRW